METGQTTNAGEEARVTSGHNISFWLSSAQPLKFNTLQHDITTEVVIVGGGIAGLTTAYCLIKSGKRVVVVEDDYIGSGETGRTTAHIVNALDDRYYHLEKLFGGRDTRLIASSHTQAINFVEETVKAEGIDCKFRRVDGYLFLHPTDKLENLKEEFAATQRAGLATGWIEGPVPGLAGETGPSIKYMNQGQFHPMQYLEGLCRAIIKYGGEIYTESRAKEISKDGVTANGFKIKAQQVVVATNTPINNMVTMHTKQHPYRTYVITALVPKNAIQPALWWDTGDQDSEWITQPYNYVRTAEYNDTHDLLICGGQDHKTGQGDGDDKTAPQRYQNLESWMRRHFPQAQEIVHRWSGQVLEPVDSIAFIGKNPGDDNIYIITGDSGNGMTHGTIGGMLITDLINGRPNEWEDIYDPSRITLKATSDFIMEATNMAAQYADYLKKGDVPSVDALPADSGAIINNGMKKVAVYRDGQGMVHAFSAICPHLKCILQWNNEEKSFDCPCHGSRFTCNGELINGPAVSNLEKVEIKE